MTVKRYTFDVIIDTPDGEVEHHVAVRAADRLRAELEAGKLRLPDAKAASQNHTTLWIYCAMLRTGLIEPMKWQEFRDNVLVEIGTPDEVEPDPTQADPSASPSPSPSTSAEDLSGGSDSTEPTSPTSTPTGS